MHASFPNLINFIVQYPWPQYCEPYKVVFVYMCNVVVGTDDFYQMSWACDTCNDNDT